MQNDFSPTSMQIEMPAIVSVTTMNGVLCTRFSEIVLLVKHTIMNMIAAKPASNAFVMCKYLLQFFKERASDIIL